MAYCGENGARFHDHGAADHRGDGMKFGLLYEMCTPRGRKESDLFWEAIEQAKVAEEAGFDCIWATEHHFLPDFASSSAPEVFLAAVAQHTSRIRIGQGVCILPYPFNHPFRAA